MCVERIIEVDSRARRKGCRIGGVCASGMSVDRIVKVGSRVEEQVAG